MNERVFVFFARVFERVWVQLARLPVVRKCAALCYADWWLSNIRGGLAVYWPSPSLLYIHLPLPSGVCWPSLQPAASGAAFDYASRCHASVDYCCNNRHDYSVHNVRRYHHHDSRHRSCCCRWWWYRIVASQLIRDGSSMISLAIYAISIHRHTDMCILFYPRTTPIYKMELRLLLLHVTDCAYGTK